MVDSPMVERKKPTRKNAVQLCVLFPIGDYDQMLKIINDGKNWLNEAEFVRDAVKDKIKRYQVDHKP